MTVAALYVERGGVYYEPGLDVDPWDETRDARRYDGPYPVVAHPPCARWCRFAPGIEVQYGYRVGDDGGCFAAALAAVHKFGGVLEHPAYSLAWREFDLPVPITADGWTGGLFGGWSAYVEQGRYGCPVKKATWLYAYGVDLPNLRFGRQSDAEPHSSVRWARVRYACDSERLRVRQADTDRTPIAFRDELISIASSAMASVA